MEDTIRGTSQISSSILVGIKCNKWLNGSFIKKKWLNETEKLKFVITEELIMVNMLSENLPHFLAF